MRWLVVIAVALAGCGGADDGEVFSGSTSTGTQTVTSTGAGGFPYGFTRCDERFVARWDVPGRTADEMVGHYSVREYVLRDNGAESQMVRTPSFSDGFITTSCVQVNDRAEFRAPSAH